MCDQFLPGPRFAVNDNAGVRTRRPDHILVNFLHHRALADDFPQPVAVPERSAELLDFPAQVFGALLEVLFPKPRFRYVFYKAIQVNDFALIVPDCPNAHRARNKTAVLAAYIRFELGYPFLCLDCRKNLRPSPRIAVELTFDVLDRFLEVCRGVVAENSGKSRINQEETPPQ